MAEKKEIKFSIIGIEVDELYSNRAILNIKVYVDYENLNKVANASMDDLINLIKSDKVLFTD